jgi:chemotaxis signal transduction protein
MSEFVNGVVPTGSGDWCVFRVGEQYFCLPATDVVDIVFFPRLTPLPRAPRLLLGIADSHITGRSCAALPVVDVRHSRVSNGDFESSVQDERHEWKYAVVINTAANGEEALLAVAADAVWHATTPEAEVLGVAAVAAALRETVVA